GPAAAAHGVRGHARLAIRLGPVRAALAVQPRCHCGGGPGAGRTHAAAGRCGHQCAAAATDGTGSAPAIPARQGCTALTSRTGGGTAAGASSLRDALWLVALGLLLFAAGLGLRDPWPADEPLHALIARNMLDTGNWLVPMVGGDFFQDKPPLLFWMQAFFYWLTGSERVGFLLPSLLAGLGTVLLVHDLGRRLWNREAGIAAALALLFTVQFTLQARRAQLDALLVFFTVLSLYCLMRQLLLGGGWRWAIGAGIAAGLGVLTKVVGFFAYLLLLPWLLALWRGWPGVRWQRPPAMWL